MTGKNRYFRFSKISEAKFRQIVRRFALDLTAGECAALTGVSVRSSNPLYLRSVNAWAHGVLPARPSAQNSKPTNRTLAHAACAASAGVAQGVTIVFGLLVSDASRRTLQAIICGKADATSIIHTDGWRRYDGLVDIGFDKHFRVNHSRNEFARGTHHVNGIESFWRFAKRRLAKFNGIARHTFAFRLKECEFRFDHRHDNLYRVLLKLLREQPL